MSETRSRPPVGGRDDFEGRVRSMQGGSTGPITHDQAKKKKDHTCKIFTLVCDNRKGSSMPDHHPESLVQCLA